MGVKRGHKYNKDTTPYVTKFVEGGKVYAFPSLKQMNCFERDVANIVEIYDKGVKLYKKLEDGNFVCMESVDSAIENCYQQKYEKWLCQEKI